MIASKTTQPRPTRSSHGPPIQARREQCSEIRRQTRGLSCNPQLVDESKSFFTDFRHRALRHHAEGIYLAERIFGVTIVNSDGARVPLRYVGERHVKEDLGRIPTVQDWLSQISPQRWMYGQRFEDVASKT
jgi:hypothetical protein